MSAHAQRSFEVPAVLVASGYGPTVDLDELDRAVEFPGAYGEWAEKVLFVENTKTLTDICGSMRLLPRGILSHVQLDDWSLLLDGLVDSDGRVWDPQFNAWGKPTDEVDIVNDTISLEDDEVAFVARALREGADEVWMRPVIPKAFISTLVAAPAPPLDRTGRKSKVPEVPPTAQEIPLGSAIIAVVDPIDEDAVLEMLAITPGPHVLRRHDGRWFEDPAWVSVLTSVKPPKIIKLTEAQVASVSTQVDRSTNDQDFELFDADSREQYQIFTASAYLRELQNEGDEKALFALVAVAGRELSPKDAASTEKLKRYWTVGKGAAKIRWGTPGSWRRCYRHLVKYVGPRIAPGYCTNLSQRLGGHGVATHVTSSADAVVAANPAGENGYDNGQQWKEGQTDRDHTGRFSSNGGSARSGRRNKSLKNRGDWYDSKSKFKTFTPKEDPDAKKAETARKKAKNDAQREELAKLSLAISEASASGDTIKAAELRVQRAERQLAFADTNIEKINAQTALNNARAALARARRVRRASPKRTSGSSPTPTRDLYEEFYDANGRYPNEDELKDLG